jgi:micrococcal nuclease
MIRESVLLSSSFLIVGCTSIPIDSINTGSGFGNEDSDCCEEDLAIEDIDPSTLPAGDSPCRDPLLGDVTSVTDGDTLHVQNVEGGSELNIRLVGVDTPEIEHGADPAECWGDEAWDYTEETLLGTRVWLTFDAECSDAYGRTLAYLHLGTAPEDFFDWRLVRYGYANVMTISPNDTFSEDLLAAEGAARADDEGLWGSCL